MGCKKTRQHRKRKNRGPEWPAEWRILKSYGLLANKKSDLGRSSTSQSCSSNSTVGDIQLDSNQSVTCRRIVDISLFVEQLKIASYHSQQYGYSIQNLVLKIEGFLSSEEMYTK